MAAPVAAECALAEDETKAAEEASAMDEAPAQDATPTQVAVEESKTSSAPAPEDEKPPEAETPPEANAVSAAPLAPESTESVVESPVLPDEKKMDAGGGDLEMGAVGDATTGGGGEAPSAAPTLAMWDEPQAVNECDPRHWNKGDVSNVITLVIFGAGVAMRMVMGKDDTAAALVLAFGLFGFAGGVTNWLAVKMLFDKIPGLIGSGVIPRRFQDILGALKTMILETFFEEAFLKEYLSTRSKSALQGIDVKDKLKQAMGGDGFDFTLARKLEALAATPDGMLLATIAPMFGGFDMMVPMIKPMLVGVGADLVSTLADNFDVTEFMDVKTIRAEIDKVLTERMTTLTPLRVKHMMSVVIREHLGWLVVWGNVFGGLIGVASWLAKY